LLRRFALASLGILALVTAFSLGVSSARSGIGPAAIGMSFQLHHFGSYMHFLTDTGQVFELDPGSNSFFRSPTFDPPIPVSQIALWEAACLVATTGDVWRLDGNQWINVGSFPGTASIPDTPHLTPSTWGKIKAEAAR
jgi:hypothetical protein